tara:strand:- start:110 stop:643 length:534 start_codon:yes stop_codon:yes gene_type:complete
MNVQIVHKPPPKPYVDPYEIEMKREISETNLELKFKKFCPDKAEMSDILSKDQLKRMINQRRRSTGRICMTEEQIRTMQRTRRRSSVGKQLWKRASQKTLSRRRPPSPKKYVHEEKTGKKPSSPTSVQSLVNGTAGSPPTNVQHERRQQKPMIDKNKIAKISRCISFQENDSDEELE